MIEAKTRAFSVNHKLMNHFHEERSNEDEVIHGMIHSKHIEERNSTQELNVQVKIPNPSTEENMILDNFQENILTEADKELEVLETSPLEETRLENQSLDCHHTAIIDENNINQFVLSTIQYRRYPRRERKPKMYEEYIY